MTSCFFKLAFYWFPITLYIGVIFFFSSLSHLSYQAPFIHFDKFLHFSEYALLAFLMTRAVNSLSKPTSAIHVFLIAVVSVSCLGALDELYQSIVPNRQSDIMDLAADALGAISGSALYLLLSHLLGKKRLSKGTSADSAA
jgi:VanZ family protein